MLMMGLELMLNGVIVAAGAFWHFLAPADADGQVIVVVVSSRWPWRWRPGSRWSRRSTGPGRST